MKLTWEEHVVLNGDPIVTDDYFGGFVPNAGSIYVPEKLAQDADGNHFVQLANMHASLGTRLGNTSSILIYKDDSDDEDECSLDAGKIEYYGELVEYAGEINVGPLTAGVGNYLYVNVETLAAGIATGGWPTGGHILRVGIISQPATGHWLPEHLENVLGSQAVRISGLTPIVVAKVLTFASDAPFPLLTVPAGRAVHRIDTWVKQAFDAPSAEIIIGDADDTDRLVQLEGIKLTAVGSYAVVCDTYFAAETPVYATWSAYGATVGQAWIRVELWP
jgi:hypothetical protein